MIDTIPAGFRPADAPADYTGHPAESYVPRCPCGWAGFRTLDLPTAEACVRYHQADRGCAPELQGALW